MGRESAGRARNDPKSREEILRLQSAARRGEDEWAGDIADEQAEEKRRSSTTESGQFKIIGRETRPSIELPSPLKKEVEDKKKALEQLQKKDRAAYEEAYPGVSLLDDKKVDAFVAKFNAPKEKLSMIERALAAIKGESKKEGDDFETAVYAVWNRTDVVRNAQSIEKSTGFSPQKARLLAAMKATTPGLQAIHSEDFLESLS